MPNLIRQIREQNGWTQQELADRVGCRQSAFHYYEMGQGNPKGDTLFRLPYVLDCAPWEVTDEWTLPMDRDAALLVVSWEHLSKAKQREVTRYIQGVLGEKSVAKWRKTSD